jgi:hypothetical protein
MPSPVLITAFVLVRKTRPLPPVAKMTDLAPIACNPPWIRSHATTPADTDFHDQCCDIPLLIHGDTSFKQLFVHGVEDGMAGTIRGITGAGEPRSAERTLGDPTLLVAAEDDPKTFQL